MLGEVGKAVCVYRGIPYAAPPVGNLRWKPPQPVTPWKGIRECTEFTHGRATLSATQPFLGLHTRVRDVRRLPLFKRRDAGEAKARASSCLVWIHGGGITSGTNSPDGVGDYMGAAGGYLTAPLPNHGVVVVTIQHRLGPIGYMAHPHLARNRPIIPLEITPARFNRALQWVQKNIAAFGGDPDRVTFFGQSGGGRKANWLVGSPLAQGLFQRAKIQAGF